MIQRTASNKEVEIESDEDYYMSNENIPTEPVNINDRIVEAPLESDGKLYTLVVNEKYRINDFNV
jgi:hypothetical protein